jgi:predicted dehydrogenase
MNHPLTRREFLHSSAALASLPLLASAGAQDAPKKSYRACVIGDTKRGGYGHGLDVCFQKLPNVTVVAVADPDEKGRAAALKRLGIDKGYADWKEMLRKEKPELVSNGPRWVEHRLETIQVAAEVGAHIYLEKPMALSLEEADQMLAVAEKAKIKTAFAHQVRPQPSVVHAKKCLDDGLIGDLLEMRSRGKEDARSGGEDLMVLGTHCMYMMRYFAGDALWCAARVLEKGKEITVENRRAATEPLGPVAGDTIHATFAFANGVQGYFDSMKHAKGAGGRFGVTLYGTKGVLSLGPGDLATVSYLPEPIWHAGKSGATWQPLPNGPTNDDPSGLHGPEAANKRIVEDLIKAAETGGQSIASGFECRAALEMIHSVYASHLAGGRVTFPLKDRKHPLGTL